MRKIAGPVVLLILDGVGSNEPYAGNAVAQSHMSFMESAWDSYPHGLLYASGEHVGLPINVKGNSEVGHTNIGAGQVVYQYLPRINQAIQKGIFFSNTALVNLIEEIKKRGTDLHILGCLSDGNVHAAMEHWQATLELCSVKGLKGNVFLHPFTDGRDTGVKDAAQYFEQLEGWMKKYQVGTIATVIGRQYSMDRAKLWDRTKKAYDLYTGHTGTSVATWQEALSASYDAGITDEFREPFVIAGPSSDAARGRIKDGDGVLFLNIRPDRTIQLTQALTDPTFSGFERVTIPKNIVMTTMVQYGKNLNVTVAFPPADVKMPLGRIVSLAGMRQLRLAEAQKFPHVTYFVNGGANIVYPGETRINIPSPNVATFDLKPEMSIYEVTNTFLKNLELGIYDFFVINFANGDMVGHTGVLKAGIEALKHVDACTASIVQHVLALNGAVFITADHGNIDEMIEQSTGEINTDHSIFPVPFIAVYKAASTYELPLGKLADIAPTLLHFLGLEIPADMTGRVLVE